MSYAAVAFGALTAEQIQTSPNGVDWTARTSPVDNYGATCIQSGAGLFVALGLSSTDGTTWIAIVSDDDGETWLDFDVPQPSTTYTAITYSPDLDLWIGLGFQGEVIGSTDGGHTWSTYATLDPPNITSWDDVTWGGDGIFVAVAGDQVATSPDGTTWTNQTAQVRDWHAVVWAPAPGSQFVVVGEPELEQSSRSLTGTSDGVTWTQHNIPLASYAGVDFDGTTYIAARRDDTGYVSSTTAATWTDHSPAPWDSFAWRVLWDPIGALWLIALEGDSGGSTVATSPDASTWTLQTTPITEHLREIAASTTSTRTLGNTWRGGFQQRAANTFC